MALGRHPIQRDNRIARFHFMSQCCLPSSGRGRELVTNTSFRPTLFVLTLWFSLLLVTPPVAADFAQQRQDFREAREARNRGDLVTFKRLLPGLVDYPLYGYLIYDDLKARNTPDSEVRAFLTRYADLPVAATLRNAWLKRLAEEERWSDFLNNYRDTQETALRCLYAQARVTSQERDSLAAEGKQTLPQGWKEEVRALWLVGKSQPLECEDTFAIWEGAGGMTTADLWQRITLAFNVGSIDLAGEIGARLPDAERVWVRVWTRVYSNPQTGLDDPLLANDSPRARIVVRHGITRLARINISMAADRWQVLKGRYSFDAEERWATERAIALRAASDRHPRALALLEHLSSADGDVRRARVRVALWEGNWPAVLRHVRALKPWERSTDRWRYWEARALEETGQLGAEEIYRELAEHRGYHGFLAADHLNLPYAFNHRTLPTVASDVARLEARPAMVRAREWFILGYPPDGRREWTAAITGANPAELVAAAQLAARWNLPDRVIATLGRSQEEDDLFLRFPLEYQELVLVRAAAAGIPPAMVFAVVRQESVFMADIRSSAGALGLMQLMPATAAQVAKGLKIPYIGTTDLIDPDRNLQLGSTFLGQLVNRQGGLALAAAAYNAGPGRVKQWRPQAKMAADVWVESIPFDETRRYVRNVLTYAVIYGWRLKRPIGRMIDEMPSVMP
ncbi:soluble lytic murein transglycosylase [Gammaproteobacteria bacterium]